MNARLLKNGKPIIGVALALAAVSTFVACGGGKSSASDPTATATTRPTENASQRAYRAEVVAATQAWLNTLTEPQRQTATYGYSATASKQQWSNFPAFFKPRTGVAYKDTSAASDKAALALAKTLLSSQGYAQYQGIRAADDYLGKTDTGGGPGGAPAGGSAGTPTSATATTTRRSSGRPRRPSRSWSRSTAITCPSTSRSTRGWAPPRSSSASSRRASRSTAAPRSP